MTDLRDQLIELELINQQTEQERHVQRLAIKEAKRQIEAEETRQASMQQAVEVDDEVQRLTAKFQRIAQGKRWAEGLLQHQWTGMMFGAGATRFILGDGMGLGKTRTAIGWLDLVAAKKVIIVCEANICDQFAGEVADLTDRTIISLNNKTPQRRKELLREMLDSDSAVVVANYELWRRDKEAMVRMLQWQADTVIVDEAHNLKRTSTANHRYLETLINGQNTCGRCGAYITGINHVRERKTDKPVRKPCEACGWKFGDATRVQPTYPLDNFLITRSVKNVAFLTGTPILNAPTDIYSLLHLIDPILFKSEIAFKSAFLTLNIHSKKWEFTLGGLNALRPLIAGRYLARTLADTDVVLPEQRIHRINIELDKYAYPLQYRTIKQITEAAKIILSNGESATIMHMISLITRKRQANVHPAGIVITDPTTGDVLLRVGDEVQESIKIDRLIENMNEIRTETPDKRHVVFSQFATALEELEVRLTEEGYRVARFDGATTKTKRTEIRTNFNRAFNEESSYDVILANYKTGGTGLNLTAATATHVLDEEWNPGKRDQAYGRTNRIGQTEESDVFVYRLVGTVDTWMANIIYRKEQMVKGFKGAMTDGDLSPMDFLKGLMDGTIL